MACRPLNTPAATSPPTSPFRSTRSTARPAGGTAGYPVRGSPTSSTGQPDERHRLDRRGVRRSHRPLLRLRAQEGPDGTGPCSRCGNRSETDLRRLSHPPRLPTARRRHRRTGRHLGWAHRRRTPTADAPGPASGYPSHAPPGLRVVLRPVPVGAARTATLLDVVLGAAHVPGGVMKRCSTCHRELPAAAFGRRTGTSDGLNYRCRRCNSAAAARSRATNRPAQRLRERAEQRATARLVRRHRAEFEALVAVEIEAEQSGRREASPQHERQAS